MNTPRLPIVLLGFTLLARATGAAPNPFFVFDNGLQNEALKTIEAQLDLVKRIGFDGLSWRTDSPGRVQQVLDGARQRGLKLFAIYANLSARVRTTSASC